MINPLVSVAVITYNQRLYIEECLRSILSQKCNFQFEIILNDDNSSDGTSEICGEMAKEYAGIISYQRNPQNMGMMGNWIDSLKKCKGKYIALCEGDDFWTDPNKLQRQVDFLEAHPNYSGCFHNTEERYEDDDNAASYLYCNYPTARNVSFSDLSYGNQMPTCSVVYRKGLFNEFPDWYSTLRMCDWPLHLLNARHGDFWYMPKAMAVHRLHKASIWMLQDPDKNNRYILEAYDRMINGFSGDGEYSDCLSRGRATFENSLSERKSTPGVKSKAKRLIIRLIEKI
jgi:glycosyltransferase involved in cell wall biosynthesis